MITGAVLTVLVLIFCVILPQFYIPRENVRRFQKVTDIGESYLLFLRQEKDETSRLNGRYHIVDNIHGKYPLDAKTGPFCRWYLNMAEELKIADMDAIPTYIAEYQLWYEALRRLYPDIFE